MTQDKDIHFMHLALEEAKRAYEREEVPVGAVIVCEDRVIACAHNSVQKKDNAMAHAECIALEKACTVQGEKYLQSCTLYVTLEPCVMCAGACFWTQIGRVVFGASDEKRGYQRCKPDLIHPKTKVIAGVLAQESTQLLQSFFRMLR